MVLICLQKQLYSRNLQNIQIETFGICEQTNIYKWQGVWDDRGLDKLGTVIILPCDELTEYTQLKNMMIGKSPCITSKFKLTYQFLLKILNNQEFDLKKFVGNSLFSQDNLQMISKHKVEKQMIQDKLNHGLNESDLKFIVEYKKKEKLLENFHGSSRKKESAKLNKLKQELRNFNNVLAKYDSYLKKKEDIKRIESSIDYLNTFVDEEAGIKTW